MEGISDLFYRSDPVLDKGDPGEAGFPSYGGGWADLAGVADVAVAAVLFADGIVGKQENG